MPLVFNFGPPLQVSIVVQARMGASRLPGKPLKKVLGKPLLFYLIERLKRCHKVDHIVIATTDQPRDEELADYAKSQRVSVVRGSEENVLSRYGLAAKLFDSDIIIRITADCPLMDPEIIDGMVVEFLDVDYLSNTLSRTFPRGLDVEIFSKKALEKALKEAKLPFEEEHVTPYFLSHPELFKLANYAYKTDESAKRWTVDTEEDFELIKRMIEALYPKKKDFAFEDMLQLVQEHPEWEDINRHIEQKPV